MDTFDALGAKDIADVIVREIPRVCNDWPSDMFNEGLKLVKSLEHSVELKLFEETFLKALMDEGIGNFTGGVQVA